MWVINWIQLISIVCPFGRRSASFLSSFYLSVYADKVILTNRASGCQQTKSDLSNLILTIMLQAAGHLFEVSLQMQRSFRHTFRSLLEKYYNSQKEGITCIMSFEYLSGILNQVAQRSLVSQFFMSTSMSIWMVTEGRLCFVNGFKRFSWQDSKRLTMQKPALLTVALCYKLVQAIHRWGRPLSFSKFLIQSQSLSFYKIEMFKPAIIVFEIPS